jgi:hypothetical protein
VLENIFQYQGQPLHEVVFVHWAKPRSPLPEKVAINDVDRGRGVAHWVTLEQIRAERASLFPEGLEELLARAHP